MVETAWVDEISRFGLNWEEIMRESSYVEALKMFPSDSFAAYRYFDLQNAERDEELRHRLPSFRNEQDMGLSDFVDFEVGRTTKGYQTPITRQAEQAFKKRTPQGISAGFMAFYCLSLHYSGLPVSKNKAAHLTSKVALEMVSKKMSSLKTGPKRILSNFRLHAEVCHYWAAEILMQQPWMQESLTEKLTNPSEGAKVLWRAARELYWAEHFRVGLLNIQGLGASTWGMRPRLYLHCTQEYEKLDFDAEWLLALLQDYSNPNVGPQ